MADQSINPTSEELREESALGTQESGNGSGSTDVPENGARLSNRDLHRAFWRYIFWFQSGWNYERFQGPGYAHTMGPIIEKLYPDPEDKKQALNTHLEFFNTNPFMAAPILGANIALEERSEGPASKEAITGLKTGMMGPFAGIGDSFFLAIYNSILFSIGSYIALDGSIIGPLLVVLFSFVPFLAFRYVTFMQGYKRGTGLVAQMAGGALRKFTDAAAILGLAVVGGLIPTIVSTEVPYVFTSGEVSIDIQEQLNTILPSAVPVLFVGLVYLLLRKGLSPTVLIFALLIVSVALSAAGVLALPEG